MMTKAEAIKMLEEMYDIQDRIHTDSDDSYGFYAMEALNMAIEALSATSGIVHCKECKSSHMTYGGLCKYCDMWEEGGDALYLEGDFYCGFGERRENG